VLFLLAIVLSVPLPNCQNIIFFSFTEPKQPGVYADVFKAVPWITEQMSKN
jgi:hypothetical protein